MAALEELMGLARQRALGKVFIACANSELQLERERLRSDLQQRGYLVFPSMSICGTPTIIATELQGIWKSPFCVSILWHAPHRSNRRPQATRGYNSSLRMRR